MEAPRITAGKAGPLLWVRVQPRSSRERLEGLHGDLLKVALNAPPVEGAANAALLRLLSGVLGVPPSALEVVRGQTGREKAVEIRGVTAAEVAARVEAAMRGGSAREGGAR